MRICLDTFWRISRPGAAGPLFCKRQDLVGLVSYQFERVRLLALGVKDDNLVGSVLDPAFRNVEGGVLRGASKVVPVDPNVPRAESRRVQSDGFQMLWTEAEFGFPETGQFLP